MSETPAKLPYMPDPHQIHLAELAARNALAEEGGGLQRRVRQRQAGKLSARERIHLLLDEGTFTETGKLVVHRATDFGIAQTRVPGDGVVTGHGRIHGRVVFVFAHDFTVFGGSLGEASAAKIVALLDTALRVGAPVVGLHDSAGARIQEGVAALAGYADIFLRTTLASGIIPQISAILGPCAGTAVFSPALTDFTFMTEHTSSLFVTGPGVPKSATHEHVTKAHLGDAATHNEISGAAHFMAPDDAQTLATLRELLAFLPSNNRDAPPITPTQDPADRADPTLETLIPADSNQPYDMVDVITRIVDDAYLFQVHEHFARNIVVGFARMAGRPVGIVANQPAYLAGVLDGDACVKAARFVRFCDCFNIPLITLEDVHGFMPGVAQEHGGIIRHGAKLLYAFAEATVPKLTVITRRAYGAGYCIMSSKHLRADLNLAWPTAEIAVMAPEGAVDIVYKREFDTALRTAQAVWPQGKAFTESEKTTLLADLRNEKLAEFRERFATPYAAAERGYVDAVIHPRETPSRLKKALDLLSTKQQTNPHKKHGNIPL